MHEVMIFVDDPSFAAAVEQLLSVETGIQVRHASSTEEILRGVNSSSVILTDLLHPDANGLGMLQILRKSPTSRETPVIVLTSSENEQLAVQALREGASSYVPMRLIASELIDTVTSILRLEEAHNNRSRIIDCMTDWYCEFRLASDRSLISPLVRYLQDVTQQMGLLCEPSEETRVGIALEEALLNGMYHGNLEVSSSLREEDETEFHALIERRSGEMPYSQRRLWVKAKVTRDEAVFCIEDDGPGFDVSTVPDPTDPVNVERVFGRGMLLMRTFMDEVEYNDLGNSVRLVKRRQLCDPS